MFDGSYRSRRTVDLGGRRNRRRTAAPSASTSAATGIQDHKSQVIESTRRLREERRQLQLQQRSCVVIQKVFRGYRMRKQVATWLATQTTTTLVVSMRLSCPLKAFLNVSVKHLLLEYQAYLESNAQPASSTFSVVALRRILPAALQHLDPKDTNDGMQRLVTFLVESTQPAMWGSEGCIALITACQTFLWSSERILFTESLWKWSCQAVATENSVDALALLAVTVLGCPDHAQQEQLVASCSIAPAVLVSSLVTCLTTTPSNNSVRLAVSNRVQGREAILLSNAIRASNSATVLPLIKYFLQELPALIVLASLVAATGKQHVVDLVMGNKKDATAAVPMDIEDESDDDDDDMHVSAPYSAAASAPRKSSGGRLTRQELQTVPKLDRLYHDQLSRLQRDTLDMLESRDSNYKQAMVDLAVQITDAGLWRQWGTSILNSHDEVSRRDYIMVLNTLLQSCTGLRNSTSSPPLLTQLAFSRELLESLWRNVLLLVVNGSSQEEYTVVATMLFCNIFSHYLIALSDKEFLRHHTVAHGKQVILAEHMIVHLRTMLHELYWNKPVVVSDMQDFHGLKAHRARLLLSGTKLWNALYERWCRLVRQTPFCDESTWWFPRLVSRDDSGAVLNIHDRPGDDESDDDDNSVESMDVDRNDTESQNDALADSFRDAKMARILTCIPQALPFERRVKLFSSLLAADKLKTQDDTREFRQAVARMMEQGREMDDSINLSGREQVVIRRDALYDDSKSKLSGMGHRLKSKVQVSFVNEHGAAEAGIDGGGVFKEFLDDLIKEAFDASQHKTGAPLLFTVTPLETLTVNMATAHSPEALEHYEFLGRVLGKAVYESILVEPQFCLPFLNQLLGKQNTLEDLKNFDPEYYANLTKLRSLSETEISNLGLTFELTLDSGNSTTRTTELMPGGSSTHVTKDNVIQYVHLVAHQRLNVEAARPTRAFLRGFRDLIPASWVRLFSAYELQKLISGDDTIRGIDVGSLKASMQYAAGYHPSQPIIQWFWQVIEELTPDQQKKFLRFMTSCSRQPLLGFQALEPAPCLQQIHLPDRMFQDVEGEKLMPLPTSATCMNLLKLPNYRSKDILRKKLMDAIESGAGFELT